MRCVAVSAARPQWAHFLHDADVGIRGCGPTAEQAFEQAAHALTAIIRSTQVEPDISIQVQCKAPRSRTAAGRMAQRHDLRNGGAENAVWAIFSVDRDGWLAVPLRGEPVDAYKDVAAAEQARLARRVTRLTPLICIKG
jgi:tRNA nucleotidyltransferase (CCA-adding enzyme)